MTDDTRAVYAMVNKVKYAVSSMRQDHRETLPKVFAEQFSRELAKDEWAKLHKGLAQTDLAVLLDTMSPDDIRAMLADDSVRAQAIRDAEAELRAAAPRSYAEYERRA
ncbi:hypothetical protein [Psychromarinibacter sp. S121]|uniref:hypothetical protein n=1 Tax=Psychromarinibacter sp. S121 TaxID=3415127 RepID=UPI003C7A702F